MKRKILKTAGLALAGLMLGSTAAMATPVPGPYVGPNNETFLPHSTYMVRDDDFGTNTYIKALSQGFQVDSGASWKNWSAFPFIGRGCSWGLCTSYWTFPRVRSVGAPEVTDYTTNTWKGDYNDSLDLWFSTYKDTSTQNNGAEVMIWLSHPGVSEHYDGSVWIDGAKWYYMKWRASNSAGSWNYVAFIRVDQTSSVASMKLNPFFWEAEKLGSLNKAWYWTNIDAGFELDNGGSGPGLAVNYFSEWNA